MAAEFLGRSNQPFCSWSACQARCSHSSCLCVVAGLVPEQESQVSQEWASHAGQQKRLSAQVLLRRSHGGGAAHRATPRAAPQRLPVLGQRCPLQVSLLLQHEPTQSWDTSLVLTFSTLQLKTKSEALSLQLVVVNPNMVCLLDFKHPNSWRDLIKCKLTGMLIERFLCSCWILRSLLLRNLFYVRLTSSDRTGRSLQGSRYILLAGSLSQANSGV